MDIRTLQELLGHESVETAQIYTHVLKKPGHGIVSPLDALSARWVAGAPGLTSIWNATCSDKYYGIDNRTPNRADALPAGVHVF